MSPVSDKQGGETTTAAYTGIARTNVLVYSCSKLFLLLIFSLPPTRCLAPSVSQSCRSAFGRGTTTSGPWIRERFCEYERATLGAEAVRQWTFVLPDGGDNLGFSPGQRRCLRTSQQELSAGEREAGRLGQECEARGLQLGHHVFRHVLLRVPCRVSEHHIKRLG